MSIPLYALDEGAVRTGLAEADDDWHDAEGFTPYGAETLSSVRDLLTKAFEEGWLNGPAHPDIEWDDGDFGEEPYYWYMVNVGLPGHPVRLATAPSKYRWLVLKNEASGVATGVEAAIHVLADAVDDLNDAVCDLNAFMSLGGN